jgi:hypothetical protein
MRVFVTNHSKKTLNQRELNMVVYHYFDDCELLKADYITPKEFHKNSGLRVLYYENDKALIEDFLKKGKIAKPCIDCEQRQNAMTHDEYTRK